MFCFNPCILQVRALKPGRSLGSLLWSQRLWRKGVQNRTQVSLLPIQALFTSLPKSSPPLPRPMQCPSELLKRALSTEAPGSRKAERLLSFCFSHFPFLSYIEDRTLVCVCGCVCGCAHARVLSRVWGFATVWSVTLQAPLSMGFPRQGYWSGLPFPSPEDLPDSDIESTSLASPALAGGFFTICATFDREIEWIVRNWKGFWSLGGIFLGF